MSEFIGFRVTCPLFAGWARRLKEGGSLQTAWAKRMHTFGSSLGFLGSLAALLCEQDMAARALAPGLPSGKRPGCNLLCPMTRISRLASMCCVTLLHTCQPENSLKDGP